MIRPCDDTDIPVIESIINEVARAYQGVIPADCWHEPYMPRRELLAEITAGVQFWGWEDSGSLIGVMGLQKVQNVTLIRHAYVCTPHQRRGVGAALLAALLSESNGQLLVGTWAAAELGHPLLPAAWLPVGLYRRKGPTGQHILEYISTPT